jgi:transcriptional regulator with XRE-family HTH domain
MTETLGERVRRFRNAAGLTQDEFARRTHVSRSHLAQVEGGVIHELKSGKILEYCDALGVSPTELLTGRQDYFGGGAVPQELVAAYGQLNPAGQRASVVLLRALAGLPEWRAAEGEAASVQEPPILPKPVPISPGVEAESTGFVRFIEQIAQQREREHQASERAETQDVGPEFELGDAAYYDDPQALKESERDDPGAEGV